MYKGVVSLWFIRDEHRLTEQAALMSISSENINTIQSRRERPEAQGAPASRSSSGLLAQLFSEGAEQPGGQVKPHNSVSSIPLLSPRVDPPPPPQWKVNRYQKVVTKNSPPSPSIIL